VLGEGAAASAHDRSVVDGVDGVDGVGVGVVPVAVLDEEHPAASRRHASATAAGFERIPPANTEDVSVA
jgi:hypothetical protein